MLDWNARVAAKAATRQKAAEAHNAMRATMRECPSTCPLCAEEKVARERRAKAPDAAPLDPQGTGMATLYNLKEAAGMRHGGFMPRKVTAAPFGGTREEWHATMDAAAAERREHQQREFDAEFELVLPLVDMSTAHMCSTEQCIECGAPAVALCDGRRYRDGVRVDGTCDAGMCAAHRTAASKGRDLCFVCVPKRRRAQP